MSKKMNFQTVPLTELTSKMLLRPDPPRPIVLVVDDEAIIADTLKTILEKNGLTAIAAYNGRKALEVALSVVPDLLLTDVVMSGMSGIDLAVALRHSIPECRVILFSGQAATINLLSQVSEAGQDFVTLAKPIHPTELLARISEELALQTSGFGGAGL